MDIQKLTKKNQEFIHIATNQLIKDGKSDQEIKDILSDVIPELIKNQKKGITGRGFLGAPTVWAASSSPEKHQQAVSGKPSKEIPETDKTPWKMWLDTSLFLLSIVAIMNAIFGFSGTQTSYGLTTLLSVSFIGGLAMYTPYHYIYRHNNKPKEERPKWWFSMTIITLSFIAWFALFSLTALLPTYLNPGLSPIVTLIIGVIAGVAKYFFKHHYNVQSTYAPVS